MLLSRSLRSARTITKNIRSNSPVFLTNHRKMASSASPPRLKYIDIGINLSDPVFRGLYHGKQAHDDDLAAVIQRARDAGVEKMMVTGSDIKESRAAISVAQEYPGICYATVGIHPCSANTLTSHPNGRAAALAELKALATESAKAGHTVAFGEIGLDYDRFYLAEKEAQLAAFEEQLDMAVELQLPLFLHMRAAAEDFERLLKARLEKLPKGGLVHSFTGSMEEMRSLVELGLDVGVNGCSLKTEENLVVVKEVPLERLQIETDGPWCEIRPSHASHKLLVDGPVIPKAVKKERWADGMMVKGRNEPCTIPLVAHVIAKLKGITVEEVCEAAWNNSAKMFGLGIP
ncbi:putative hydrolase [Microthyrium microscopicum]|uniref:Putative hydrolase n=1 Tax=Microthyrium microscopicum TaxID=703497 RepID=A0A6A6U2M6_9PEZI|nr:putative hydrolase [Microthyrium microscopicum]